LKQKKDPSSFPHRVHVERSLNLVFCQLQKRLSGHDSGIVDQQVDFADFRLDLGSYGLDNV